MVGVERVAKHQPAPLCCLHRPMWWHDGEPPAKDQGGEHEENRRSSASSVHCGQLRQPEHRGVILFHETLPEGTAVGKLFRDILKEKGSWWNQGEYISLPSHHSHTHNTEAGTGQHEEHSSSNCLHSFPSSPSH